jgi:hypothetical protein
VGRLESCREGEEEERRRVRAGIRALWAAIQSERGVWVGGDRHGPSKCTGPGPGCTAHPALQGTARIRESKADILAAPAFGASAHSEDRTMKIAFAIVASATADGAHDAVAGRYRAAWWTLTPVCRCGEVRNASCVPQASGLELALSSDGPSDMQRGRCGQWSGASRGGCMPALCAGPQTARNWLEMG